jgi:hypothetical protein
VNPFIAAVAIAFAQGAEIQQQPIPVQFARSIAGQSVTVYLDGWQVKSTFAGKLGFQDRLGSWFSVCANVRAPMARGQAFYVHPKLSASMGGNFAKAGNIVAKYLATAQTPEQCAGLQLAVWEAIEDGGAKADFSGGKFMARGSANAITYAEMYYASVAALDEETDPVYLEPATAAGQAQLTTAPKGRIHGSPARIVPPPD